jgi:hypothetical protein
MEQAQNEHPDLDDDAIWELVCQMSADRHAAAIDRHKENRRESF